MKIVLPYNTHFGKYDTERVVGGIEKFCHQINDTFDGHMTPLPVLSEYNRNKSVYPSAGFSTSIDRHDIDFYMSGGDNFYDFFSVRVNPKTKKYESEDYEDYDQRGYGFPDIMSYRALSF